MTKPKKTEAVFRRLMKKAGWRAVDGKFLNGDGRRSSAATWTALAIELLDASQSHSILTFMTLSTGHIRPETGALLAEKPESIPGGAYGEYGWFMWCATENCGDPPIPDDLWRVMQFARKNGCDYLLLDRDGKTTDALPTWVW